MSWRSGCWYRPFTGELRETQIFDVFDSYVAGGGSRMMEEAFLTYYAHGYFRKGWDVPESIFSYIRRGYPAGGKVERYLPRRLYAGSD